MAFNPIKMLHDYGGGREYFEKKERKQGMLDDCLRTLHAHLPPGMYRRVLERLKKSEGLRELEFPKDGDPTREGSNTSRAFDIRRIVEQGGIW